MACEVFTVPPEQNAVGLLSGPVTQWLQAQHSLSLFSHTQWGGNNFGTLGEQDSKTGEQSALSLDSGKYICAAMLVILHLGELMFHKGWCLRGI